LVFWGAHPDDETFGMGATLAHYASAGVKVYCVCSTRGEVGTVDPEFMQGHSSVAEVRTAEMACAARVLGLAEVFYLGYRDSGMRGSPENENPACLHMAPVEEVAGKIVRIIREIQPDVVITHDAGGGYGHPDHVATHKAVVAAFFAAPEPDRYPENGTAYRPAKLYFGVRPRQSMKLRMTLLKLSGQDLTRMGRNKDVDMTKMPEVEYPVHAIVRLSKQDQALRSQAAACHASQGGGRPARMEVGWVLRCLRLMERSRKPQDYFMRAYPNPTQHLERDLFEGVE
jgi:N-acetyl-1-D-myo-inositol-2-amino-2-deoxy-alpha-D-glucopyranoside deacetylase